MQGKQRYKKTNNHTLPVDSQQFMQVLVPSIYSS